MGHVPRRGEVWHLGTVELRVLLTKGGAVRWFQVRCQDQDDTQDEEGSKA
jgi:Mg2+/Co2+ transporter CorC